MLATWRNNHEPEWAAAEVDCGREAADRAGRPAGRGGSRRTMSPRGDQPHAVLRLEEATAVVGDQGVRRPGGQAQRVRGAEGSGAAADEGRGRGDHRGELGAKKRALGL